MHTIFRQAIDTIINGHTTELESLLENYPNLVLQREDAPHQATLLHYIAANGVESNLQKTPANAVEIAELLLEAGAEPDATSLIYGGPVSTTMELLVSSVWPFLAGVQHQLVELLIKFGASPDGPDDRGAPLGLALGFGYTQTAETLASLGARHDNLLYAAGLGKLDLVKSFFDSEGRLKGEDWRYTQHESSKIGRFFWPPPANPNPIAAPFVYACQHGQDEVLKYFLEIGIDPNISASYQQTGLHFAAYSGRKSTVSLLLEGGATPNIRESQLNRTPKEWAAELEQTEVMKLLP